MQLTRVYGRWDRDGVTNTRIHGLCMTVDLLVKNMKRIPLGHKLFLMINCTWLKICQYAGMAIKLVTFNRFVDRMIKKIRYDLAFIQ